MARADLLTNLVEFGVSGDKGRFRRVAEVIIAEERAKQHTVLADKLEKILRRLNGNGTLDSNSAHQIGHLLHEISPQKGLDDLILPDEVQQICKEMIQEHHRMDLLRSYNLEPRNRILLIGPPGNGKTSLAEALAESLMVPLYVIRYEGVIGSYLGETAVRLRRLIEHASTRRCVLFFDEFETLVKERGDSRETGEIKRVISSLLLQIDALPSHVVVIGATNHSELLDRAVWRRFQVRMNIPSPTPASAKEWFDNFQQRVKIDFGYSSETLAKKLHRLSYAEIEEFGMSVLRQHVLGQPGADTKKITSATLKNWAARSAKTEKSTDKRG